MPRQRFTNGDSSAQLEWVVASRDQAMLRIEKYSDGRVCRLRLSGRIQSDGIATIRSAMIDGCARQILDLSEVTLVDIAAVRFLLKCEDEGVELAHCPLYVREWMLRERTEGAEPGSSIAT